MPDQQTRARKVMPPSNDPQFDFATLLEESFQSEENNHVERGDLLTGTIVARDAQGLIIDVGMKRDGVVSRTDLDAVGDSSQYQVGQTITVMVLKTEDDDGNLVVSLKHAQASVDWDAALAQMEADELYVTEVAAANDGGLIVPYGQLRGFVPASHVADLPRGLRSEERTQALRDLVGRKLELKIIEVNPRRRRLVLSQREAQREARDAAKDDLLDNLNEGDTVKGRVSSLRDFGAFIDLGGADGLIHVSELSWSRVQHPDEILKVGQELDVFVLQLDRDSKRIGLSLKRLHANPWDTISEAYQLNQMVEGTVSRLVSFGAFIELNNGIEALLHVTQMGAIPPEDPSEMVTVGDKVTTRIISLEPDRQRIGLSLMGQGEGVAILDDELVDA